VHSSEQFLEVVTAVGYKRSVRAPIFGEAARMIMRNSALATRRVIDREGKFYDALTQRIVQTLSTWDIYGNFLPHERQQHESMYSHMVRRSLDITDFTIAFLVNQYLFRAAYLKQVEPTANLRPIFRSSVAVRRHPNINLGAAAAL